MKRIHDLSRPLARLGRIVAVSALLAAAGAIAPSVAAPGSSVRTVCADAITAVEQQAGVPHALMTAISLAESGRWFADQSASIAWPWTVTNGTTNSWYFPDKASAVAKVRALQRKGITNIDVGCMQINLRYHPDAFDSIEEALDPAANARYAADLLTRLNQAHRSWGDAIRHYHSATPELHRRYHDKVVRLWNDNRHRAAVARREQREETLTAMYEEREREEAERRAAAEAKRQAVIAAWKEERLRRALGPLASN